MLEAAVVVPIVRHVEPTLVFIRRAAHLRRNPGEIAFPGGIVDAADGDVRSAALREFEEELGVPREYVRIIDRLEDVTTRALSVVIAPFIGLIDAPATFVPDGNETQSVHEVPLRALYAPGALHRGFETIAFGGRMHVVETWQFDYEGLHVWGATAQILHCFIDRYSLQRVLTYVR